MSSLIVYGDSYSDIHIESKRTNGPLWSQILSKQWNTSLVSFAQSGSSICPSKTRENWLEKQVGQSLSNIQQGNIYAIFLGVTDMLETKNDDKNEQWIQCIRDQVTFIRNKDPEARILILGVPALDFSPYAKMHEELRLKEKIMKFNVDLEEKVEEWKETEQIEFYNTYLMFSDLLGDPSSAHIDNVDDAYWEACQGQCKDQVNSYLWWDTIHMTGAGHTTLANSIASNEFFNMKATTPATTSFEEESSSGELETSSTGQTTMQDYTQCLSWLLLGCLVMMVFYSLRHNRYFVNIKNKIQSKTSKLYRKNHHDYTLV
ncbi:hypothetical protein G6F46_005614 [Rhizopus delemar]|uniref:SGNH hydrolase-type esterase domain-containing protein n=3 Tax=Rhizopus TaxID=4842 RepID=I1BS52_RHIO9|nr:hypothetical protein RO3G_03737 [Rhizopus delemar RA 99-880]KAG1456934.1 hypothetical protein G6F55_006218 [Rhizopus delemar]KAG1541748.1 hypothetical protein G6F51_007702 [Rhizopus arrhizus]KAG1498664.1 hypothetical protein G6F54_004928 [Rhizopus delemar]KAG1512482.1 hypothetical protein G6F53_005152 [Rhizopus delemar]|eukprot:EIE79032.1 hypothetical protein RO3G_03737 [Rhizopus delemar RA 99-880]